MSVIQDPPRTRQEKDRRKTARKKKQARQARAKKQAHKEECMFKNTLPKLPGSKKPTEFEVLAMIFVIVCTIKILKHPYQNRAKRGFYTNLVAYSGTTHKK